MTGKALSLLLLAFCTEFGEIFGTENDLKIIDVPAEVAQNQEFLKYEREWADNSPDIYYDEDTEDWLREKYASTGSPTPTQDVLTYDIPDQVFEFLNNEKMHANKLAQADVDLASTSDYSDLNEVEGSLVKDSTFTSDLEQNQIEHLQPTDIPSNLEMVENFLDSERSHSLSAALESLTLTVQSERSVSSLGICGTVNLNKIVDELLVGLRKDLMERGLDRIKIPDLHETFVKKMGFFHIVGHFDANQGWAKNLTTIHRTADVTATSKGKTIAVNCGFGLSDLEFGYDSYKVRVFRIGPSGHLSVSIADNSVLVEATVHWNNGSCNATLDSLVMNKLGGFHVEITGLGPMNWLLRNISNWLLRKFQNEIKVKVEQALIKAIDRQLVKFHCNHLFT